MAFNIVAGVNNAVYGSVSGSGSYVEGAEVTLEVTANDGYRFVSWDDGSTDNPRVFNATEDVTLVATLEVIPEYAISVTTNDNSLGTVSGSGTFREGTSTQISATPYVHSRFVNWEDGNSDNPRTITVYAATTYKAIFEAVNYFTISTDVNDANLGSVTGAGEYDEGDTVTLTAVPETGCRFVSWNDGNTDNPRIFTSSADVTYTATFEEIQYTDVTIASNDVSWGTVSGAVSGNIETGTTITLTATPATDYKFDGWQVDGEVVSVSPIANFLVDGQEMDIIAVFSAIVFYQVTLITNDVDCGSISIVSATAEPRGEAHNIWPDGTIINLQAVTTEGGRFLNWSTGQVVTEITVNVHGNETIRANFYPVTGLILVTKKIFQHAWSTIKSFFSAPTGASKIGAPANNALGATTLADVVNSVGQANGLAQLNEDGKINISDLGGSGAEGLDVDITGNAATATSADSADVAAKIGTTTVGSSTEPVYINAGTPTACGGSLDVDITGNAATATDSTTVKELNGTSNYNRPILLSGLTDITTTTDNQTTPVYSNNFYANPSTGVATSVNGFSTSKSYTTSLTTSTHLAGNKGTALINSTAAKGYTMLARMKSTNGVFTHGVYNADYQFYYTADSLISAGTNNVTKTCLTINENGTVSAPNGFVGNVTGNCSGSSGSCTGNAATATSATNTNNAKLTHTVGNTEYPLVFGTSFVITDAQQALRIGTPTATAANCALRCKSYCAAANTQGEAYLVCGNNIAKASANNARGSIYLYGTNANNTRIIPSDTSASITITLPASTGTLALANANTTGSSGSCTGNAASATYATNIRVTDTDSNTWYPLVFSSGSAANTNYAARVDADSILVYPGASPAANTQGNCYLQLGNNKAKATAGNKRGVLRIYGTGTAYTEITSAVGSTARSISFPDKAGTVALTSDIRPSIDSIISFDFQLTTTYICDEIKFGSGLKLKFIYPRNNSVSLTPSADETVTFGEPFTTVASVLRGAFSISGNQYIMSYSSTNTKRVFGYFSSTLQSGYSSAGEGGHLTLTSYKIVKDNPTPLVIIVGY